MQKYVECALLHQGGSGSAAEADDSSYDSDYEAEETSQHHVIKQHSNVSRTTSDTLAAEFAEYVTLQHPTNACTTSTTQNPGNNIYTRSINKEIFFFMRII